MAFPFAQAVDYVALNGDLFGDAEAYEDEVRMHVYHLQLYP